jgi:hypothetical protein
MYHYCQLFYIQEFSINLSSGFSNYSPSVVPPPPPPPSPPPPPPNLPCLITLKLKAETRNQPRNCYSHLTHHNNHIYVIVIPQITMSKAPPPPSFVLRGHTCRFVPLLLRTSNQSLYCLSVRALCQLHDGAGDRLLSGDESGHVMLWDDGDTL